MVDCVYRIDACNAPLLDNTPTFKLLTTLVGLTKIQAARHADDPADDVNPTWGHKYRRVKNISDSTNANDAEKKDVVKKAPENKGEHQDAKDDETFNITFSYGKGKTVQLHESGFESKYVAQALLGEVILPADCNYYTAMSKS